MGAFDIANGAAVFTAVLCAVCMPRGQRGPATGLVALFALNWLHYVLSWSDMPPVSVLWGMGLMVRSDDVWCLLDALTAVGAVICAVMTCTLWPWLIYVIALVQIICHVLFWDMAQTTETLYYNSLDWLFWGQIAVFLLAGGKGVKDRVTRIGRSFRLDRTGAVGRSRQAVDLHKANQR